MKPYLIFGIFLFIANRTKTTAKEIAEHFEVSQRSIYRYIDALCIAGIPLIVKNGKNGGVSLPPNHTVENILLSKKEKVALLSVLNCNISEDAKQIINKLCA